VNDRGERERKRVKERKKRRVGVKERKKRKKEVKERKKGRSGERKKVFVCV